MKEDVNHVAAPVIMIPYVWIGDFVRCHSVVKLLRAKNPNRPIDIVSSTLCAPLADYMPGVRRAIVVDLPRGKLGLALQRKLASMLQEEKYGQAIVMSRKWKAALPPWLAGIPLRTGFAGEFRFGLLNDVRLGESKLPRMIDQMGALALPKGRTDPSRLAAARIENTERGNRCMGRAARARRRKTSHRHPVTRRRRCRQGMAGSALRGTRGRAHRGWRLGLGAGRAQ